MADRGEQIRVTMYSDGASCPSGCDSHVVFDIDLNGTAAWPLRILDVSERGRRGTACR